MRHNVVGVWTAAALTSTLLLGAMINKASSQSAFEQCNKVLEGDLMNKVITSSQADLSARRALRMKVLSSSVDEAFSIYSQEIDSAKKQGQKGSLGVNYFGIGGDADFDINYDNKLSKAQFSEKFNKAKRIFQQSGEQLDSTNTSLASAFASYIRDPNSIEAWKACVTQQPQTGLFAFASRDDSDQPILNVVWGPGLQAGTFPRIKIKIDLPQGATISDTTDEVAAGSGHAFRIDFPDHKRGFQIIVNGSTFDPNGKLANSFSAMPRVPPVAGAEIPPATTRPLSDCTFGKNTCKQGFVWRVANPTDLVCVPSASRDRAAQDNATAGQRQIRRRVGGRFVFVCRTPFVRRGAFQGDGVCVTTAIRRITASENRLAQSRIACLQ